jgi:hypothetical protein
MAGMHATSKRRWFRFRLSTVLILTALTAWAMATRPQFHLHHVNGVPVTPEFSWVVQLGFGYISKAGTRDFLMFLMYVPKHSILPVLALATFLA